MNTTYPRMPSNPPKPEVGYEGWRLSILWVQNKEPLNSGANSDRLMRDNETRSDNNCIKELVSRKRTKTSGHRLMKRKWSWEVWPRASVGFPGKGGTAYHCIGCCDTSHRPDVWFIDGVKQNIWAFTSCWALEEELATENAYLPVSTMRVSIFKIRDVNKSIQRGVELSLTSGSWATYTNWCNISYN